MNPKESEISVNTTDSKTIEKKAKKNKHKDKKHKKKKKHKLSDSEFENQKRVKSKKRKSKHKKQKEVGNSEAEDMPGPSVPVELVVDSSKSRAPMTKEEWEKSQSVIRRVYDETGRSRLIKGDGEILEEIVSKEKHKEINRQATLGDGLYFQSKLQKTNDK